jgi:flagellar basal-body rod protein FlgB
MNIDKLIDVHADALRTRAHRTKLIASNIANSDTPNYKARDLAFADTLKNISASGSPTLEKLERTNLTTTHKKHMAFNSSTTQSVIMYRQPNHASLDGNTVDKDAEQARFAENAVRYQASLEFLGSRITSIVRTLRGE